MIAPQDFDRIVYRFPKLEGKGKTISHCVGLDTEAYSDGQPFLICLSTGETLSVENPLEDLFTVCQGEHVAVYNLKYDSGAILRSLPEKNLTELWKTTTTTWKKIKITYIPHKSLALQSGKSSVYVWDVSQYYKMSLDRAAERYLGKRKLSLDTKEFSREYVEAHYTEIKNYCIQDAVLCAELANFLLRKLAEFGIRTTALYSSAALSFRYFTDRTKIVTAWRYWRYYREVLRFAQEAYEGGKFEVTVRGKFDTAYEYDLVSAYPYEIANLVDVTLAKVVRSQKYVSEATYAYLRVRIENPRGLPTPCGVKVGNLRIYPAGEWYSTITKAEYDYLMGIGCTVEIIDGYWLCVSKQKFPYRSVVAELFELKDRYKDQDSMLYEVSKRMLNSFYGKSVQLIPDCRGRIVAGHGWNPLYAAVITANVRIKVTKIQTQYGERCLAVHTDSALLLDPMPEKEATGGLGEFAFKEKGAGVVIGCGQYQIGSKGAYKGFEPLAGDNWQKILLRSENRYSCTYPVLRVHSWIDAIARGRISETNVFERTEKIIDFNADNKRAWFSRVKGRDLLEKLHSSAPLVICQERPPEYWQ